MSTESLLCPPDRCYVHRTVVMSIGPLLCPPDRCYVHRTAVWFVENAERSSLLRFFDLNLVVVDINVHPTAGISTASSAFTTVFGIKRVNFHTWHISFKPFPLVII